MAKIVNPVRFSDHFAIDEQLLRDAGVLNPTLNADIRAAAFLILQTSYGSHQAWVAVEGGDREFASRLKKGTHADLTASGSVRVVGSFNYKRKYAPNFPTVTIEEAHPGRIMTRAELEGRGLVAPAPPKPEGPASPFDVLTGRTVWRGPATSAALRKP